MRIIEQIMSGNFDFSYLYPWVELMVKILIIYSIIYGVILIISLFKLFIKEGYKGWYAFIPLYNMYIYFKIAQLPFIYFFVPFINIFMLILIPYNLCKIYGVKDFLCYLALLFPFIFIPYIAFSKLENKTKVIEVSYDFLKTKKDIDDLENSLKIDTDDNTVVNDNQRTERNTSNDVDVMEENKDQIDVIRYDRDDDAYVEDEESVESISKETHENILKDEEELIDIEDEENVLSYGEIDKLDKEIEQNSNVDIKMQQDIKDFEKDGPSVNAIAFGGKDEKENLAQAKKEEHKCPRCGSDLVGATDRCPGCGLELKNIS